MSAYLCEKPFRSLDFADGFVIIKTLWLLFLCFHTGIIYLIEAGLLMPGDFKRKGLFIIKMKNEGD